MDKKIRAEISIKDKVDKKLKMKDGQENKGGSKYI